MSNLDEARIRVDRPSKASRRKAERSRGQILVLFVLALFIFTGMVALVIDVSWYWVSSLRIQRAADAAALAGAVQLPTNPTGPGGAFDLAMAEARKNGYANGDPSVTITPMQEPAVTGRRLAVTITAPIDTFFMRLIGINTIMSTRVSKAEYVLPVPMGSPDNYYGVFGEVRGRTVTETVDVMTHPNGDSGLNVPTSSLGVAGTAWTSTNGTLVDAVEDEDNDYAQADANGDNQQWGNFNLLGNLVPATDQATTVNGIEVELIDAHVETACVGTFIEVALSYDGGDHWTTDTADNRVPTTGDLDTTPDDITLGSASSLAAWHFSPAHTWVGDDLGNSRFRLRLTANNGCGSGAQIRVDQVRVRALYDVDRVTPTLTTTTLPDEILRIPGALCPGVAACYEADGDTIPNPNGFWGTMNTEGAESINGDAYQPYYNINSSSVKNPDYNADDFYNYAVEMPPDSTGGQVFVFDPVFCATATDKGTGDRWFNDPGDPVSSFFELYNTEGTLHDRTDDTLITSSDGRFRNIDGSDTTMGGATGGSPSPCNDTEANYGDGRDFHNRWYLLASGLDGGEHGTVYRVHTTSTDPANDLAQRGTDGENSFALYARASGGGTPRIYGIGAMQAFTPLTSSSTVTEQASEFYLAQIEAVHAGKTVEIKLWDPGDTRPLRARLQILVPNSGGWSETNFDYSAAKGTTNSNAANCNSEAGDDVPAVQTNAGDTPGTFNGCWLTISIGIPAGYVAEQDGWWKIRYLMRNTQTGSATSNDVTTWKVAIRGNPVHLIVP